MELPMSPPLVLITSPGSAAAAADTSLWKGYISLFEREPTPQLMTLDPFPVELLLHIPPLTACLTGCERFGGEMLYPGNCMFVSGSLLPKHDRPMCHPVALTNESVFRLGNQLFNSCFPFIFDDFFSWLRGVLVFLCNRPWSGMKEWWGWGWGGGGGPFYQSLAAPLFNFGGRISCVKPASSLGAQSAGDNKDLTNYGEVALNGFMGVSGARKSLNI